MHIGQKRTQYNHEYAINDFFPIRSYTCCNPWTFWIAYV